MRRFAFYGFIALLTFGVGSFIAVNLCFHYKQEKTSSEKLQTLEKPQNPISMKETKPNISPVCTDEVLLSLWNDLKTVDKYENRNCLKEMFNVEAFDLNSDGKKEFLILGDIGFCGMSGNCSFWIYRKFGNKYQNILTGYSYLDGRDIFSQIKKSRTNKFKDILLEVHLFRGAHAYRLYKFDGKNYEDERCRVHQWNEAKPDEKIKIMTCKEFEKSNYRLDFE